MAKERMNFIKKEIIYDSSDFDEEEDFDTIIPEAFILKSKPEKNKENFSKSKLEKKGLELNKDNFSKCKFVKMCAVPNKDDFSKSKLEKMGLELNKEKFSKCKVEKMCAEPNKNDFSKSKMEKFDIAPNNENFLKSKMEKMGIVHNKVDFQTTKVEKKGIAPNKYDFQAFRLEKMDIAHNKDGFSKSKDQKIGTGVVAPNFNSKLDCIKAKLDRLELSIKTVKIMELNMMGIFPSYDDTSALLCIDIDQKQETDARSIYIGNVDYTTTALQVEEHFKNCGRINRVTIPCNNWRPKGYAFLEFSDVGSVEKALKLNESILGGRFIKVMKKRTNKPGLTARRRFGRKNSINGFAGYKRKRDIDGSTKNYHYAPY